MLKVSGLFLLEWFYTSYTTTFKICLKSLKSLKMHFEFMRKKRRIRNTFSPGKSAIMSAQFLAEWLICPRPCLWCPHCGGMNIPRPSQRSSSSQKNLQRMRIEINFRYLIKRKAFKGLWTLNGFIYRSFLSLILDMMKSRSVWDGANKDVKSGSVKARQWSTMSGLSSAKDSGMYQPNLKR